MAVTFDIPSFTSKETPKYPVGPKFDIEKGDYVLDSSGNIVMATPEETWQQWCIKALSTERFTKRAYSDNMGIETTQLWVYPEREAKELWLKRTIEEALMADPWQRTMSVKEIKFDYFKPDSVYVEIVIVGRQGEQYKISKEIDTNG